MVVFAGLDVRSASGQERHHSTNLIIVKHWHFSLAAPAPKHFHREDSILSRLATGSTSVIA
jgi:hypothetical protein